MPHTRPFGTGPECGCSWHARREQFLCAASPLLARSPCTPPIPRPGYPRRTCSTTSEPSAARTAGEVRFSLAIAAAHHAACWLVEHDAGDLLVLVLTREVRAQKGSPTPGIGMQSSLKATDGARPTYATRRRKRLGTNSEVAREIAPARSTRASDRDVDHGRRPSSSVGKDQDRWPRIATVRAPPPPTGRGDRTVCAAAAICPVSRYLDRATGAGI